MPVKAYCTREVRHMDFDKAFRIGRLHRNLGDAVVDQLEAVLQDGEFAFDEQNPNALKLMVREYFIPLVRMFRNPATDADADFLDDVRHYITIITDYLVEEHGLEARDAERFRGYLTDDKAEAA